MFLFCIEWNILFMENFLTTVVFQESSYLKRYLTEKQRTANIALAIWRGDEYILSFLFATQLRSRQTNNAEQQNKQ